jgi:hypothetical protein
MSSLFGQHLADTSYNNSRQVSKPRQPHTKQQVVVDQALESRRLKYMYHVTRRRRSWGGLIMRPRRSGEDERCAACCRAHMPTANGAIAHAATGSWKAGRDGKQTTDDLSKVPRYDTIRRYGRGSHWSCRPCLSVCVCMVRRSVSYVFM